MTENKKKNPDKTSLSIPPGHRRALKVRAYMDGITMGQGLIKAIELYAGSDMIRQYTQQLEEELLAKKAKSSADDRPRKRA